MIYPEKKKLTQKLRTDLATGTEYPKFSKHVFKFENVSLGNRLVMKFGLFKARNDVDVTRPESVTEGALLHGSANELFTQNFITRLRRNRGVEKTLIFLTPED